MDIIYSETSPIYHQLKELELVSEEEEIFKATSLMDDQEEEEVEWEDEGQVPAEEFVTQLRYVWVWEVLYRYRGMFVWEYLVFFVMVMMNNLGLLAGLIVLVIIVYPILRYRCRQVPTNQLWQILSKIKVQLLPSKQLGSESLPIHLPTVKKLLQPYIDYLQVKVEDEPQNIITTIWWGRNLLKELSQSRSTYIEKLKKNKLTPLTDYKYTLLLAKQHQCAKKLTSYMWVLHKQPQPIQPRKNIENKNYYLSLLNKLQQPELKTTILRTIKLQLLQLHKLQQYQEQIENKSEEKQPQQRDLMPLCTYNNQYSNEAKVYYLDCEGEREDVEPEYFQERITNLKVQLDGLIEKKQKQQQQKQKQKQKQEQETFLLKPKSQPIKLQRRVEGFGMLFNEVKLKKSEPMQYLQ